MPARATATARVSAQAEGIVAGLGAARAVAEVAGLRVDRSATEGDRVRRGTVVLEIHGPTRSLLAAERTMLNFLMHLSGVATATHAAVRAVGTTGPEVRATRKTLPGLRDLEKAAVVAGGGRPHRRDLSAAILIKNNHLAVRPLGDAVAAARRTYPGRPVEVEVGSFAEAKVAAEAGASELLIDNATPARARRIIAGLRRSGLRDRMRIELSGGITPGNAGRYRSVGADALSLGALTHSAVALPFHMTVVPRRRTGVGARRRRSAG